MTIAEISYAVECTKRQVESKIRLFSLHTLYKVLVEGESKVPGLGIVTLTEKNELKVELESELKSIFEEDRLIDVMNDELKDHIGI